MPRDVVPILRSPRRASLRTSSSRWYGRIRCAFSLMSSRSPTSMPSAASSSISANSACGSTTTPLPMTQVHAVVQDAGRDEVQHELLAADVDRVARVVAALIAGHDRRNAASAGRRSCPCLRRPTARRGPRCSSFHRIPVSLRSDLHHASSLDARRRLTVYDRRCSAIARPGRLEVGHRGPAARARVVRGARAVVDDLAEGEAPVYGINTGFGNFAETRIERGDLAALQVNLVRSHAAGVDRAAAAARRAGDDGAARERAGQGLFGHPPSRRSTRWWPAQPRRAPARAQPWIGRRERRPRAAGAYRRSC